MEDTTTWQPGDRVRVFAPGRPDHGMAGVVDRQTAFPTGDLWVRLERNGHVGLYLPGELRHPMLTMGSAARAALAVWHASGGTGRERELRKLSDNVVGQHRVRRYANDLGVHLELSTFVATCQRPGAERIGDGHRARRAACTDCGSINRESCCCAANKAEAARRWAAIGAAIPGPADDTAAAPTPGRWVVHYPSCDPDADCGSYGCPCCCHPDELDEPPTPAALGDRMRALLTKAGAVIR